MPRPTRDAYRVFLLLFIFLVPVAPLVAGQARQVTREELQQRYPMRWRTFADQESGFSFRFPYGYGIPNQYHPGLMRQGGGAIDLDRFRDDRGRVDGDALRRFLAERKRRDAFDIELVTAVRGELPADRKNLPLPRLAAALAKMDGAAFADYDYYAVEGRPHADRNWAPRGVLAVLGEGKGRTALALEQDGRIGVLVATGALDDHDNRALLASFEVMRRRGRGYSTWRQQACLGGRVLAADGSVLAAARSEEENVDYPRAWEVETAHYHITSNVSPQHLVQYGRMAEALYAGYTDTYDPDTVPGFKLEMHILHSKEDFGLAGLSRGIDGRRYAGFFAPGTLAIFAYENHKPQNDPSCLFHVLAHECSHQFLHVTCNGSSHVPTWLNEGLAVTFESSKIVGGKLKIHVPKKRMRELTRNYAMRKKTLVPLEQYLRHYGGIPYASYAESYAITQYLINAGTGSKRKFKEYWQALRDGENGTEAFDRIFLVDLIKQYDGDRSKAIQAWHDNLVKWVLAKYK